MTFAWRRRRPSLRATPNPVRAPVGGFGRTTLHWDTGDGSTGHLVLVGRHGAAEEEISMAAGPSGSAQAIWIRHDFDYLFRLYRRDPPGGILAETIVTTNYQQRETVADVAFLAGVVALVGSALTVVTGAAYVGLRGAAALGRLLKPQRDNDG